MNAKTVVNILTLVLIMGGGFFKVNHWAGADMLLLTGALLLLGTIVFAIRDMKFDGMSHTMIYLIGTTLVLHVLTTIFKSMHWEGGNMLVLIAYVFTVLSAIVYMLNKAEIKLPKQVLITTFLYLILIMNLLVQSQVVNPA